MGSAKEESLDFARMKASILQSRKLFEDPQFPAGPKAIGGDKSTADITWMRPKEISSNPRFIERGATRFDLNQGNLGNCWFVAAAACLATSHKQLFEYCIPPDQEFDKDYAGIFHFRFWQFGLWVEVIIDDLLPCQEVSKDGKKVFQPIYARNDTQTNEFWVPLFEKAYAKLNGSYMNLESGLINDALVDFTGGITERIDVIASRRSPGNLFEMLSNMMQMASLIGTHIIVPTGRVTQQPNGLYTGHAYSVTKVQQVKGTSNRLLRIRNPWGRKEWNGSWSDGSREWATLPDNVKKEFEFEKLEDGEFWISFEDWLKNFNRMAICHLSPDALTKEISEKKGKGMWDEDSYKSEWVPGFNAGGSAGIGSSRKFWTNPQFPFSSKSSKGDTGHVVISLMQKYNNNQYSLDIGFGLAQIKEGVALRPIGQNYDENETVSTQMVPCQPFREVSGHFELPLGNYIVIPCTQFANTPGEFLLRIYTELK